MRRVLLVTLLAASCVTVPARPELAVTGFYDQLAPHGEWVTLEPYGQVWRPAVREVGPDFHPYFTGGWWVSSSSGWQWQSVYSWGWISFHHGRWVRAEPYGWVWVPGDEWAPAWVEWRVGGGNVGWVPLGPAGVTTLYPNYHPRWVFVPLARFPSHNFHNARLSAYQEYDAYHRATSIPFDRGDGLRGPSPELVMRAGGKVTTVPAPAPPRMVPGSVRAEARLKRPPAAPPVMAPPPPGQPAPPGTVPVQGRKPPPKPRR